MARSYIIHLETSTTRQPQVDALCAALPNAQVVDAVDGRLMSVADRDVVYRPKRYDPPYPFALLPGEVGCFLSHRKCWELIANSKDDYGLIFDDDVVLDADLFSPAWALAKTHMTPDRFIRLPLTDREAMAKTFGTSGQTALFRPKQIALGTPAQMVGRNVALRLIDLTAPFDRPVDTFLQMNWLTGADVATVYPNGLRSVAEEQGGSTIQKKKNWAEKLPREWHRMRYRSKIRALAARHLG